MAVVTVLPSNSFHLASFVRSKMSTDEPSASNGAETMDVVNACVLSFCFNGEKCARE